MKILITLRKKAFKFHRPYGGMSLSCSLSNITNHCLSVKCVWFGVCFCFVSPLSQVVCFICVSEWQQVYLMN